MTGQGNRFQAEVGPLASNHRSDWAKLQEAVIHEREKDKRLLRTRSCGLFLARQLMSRRQGQAGPAFLLLFPLLVAGPRLGDEERRLKHLVPAPAVSLMKSRVKSRPGINSLMSFPGAWSVV